MKGLFMITRSISRHAVAAGAAVAVVAGGLSPVATAAPASTQADAPARETAEGARATGPGSSDFTQAEVDNAKRFAGLLAGILAVLVTFGVAGLYFASPHLGIQLPDLPGLPGLPGLPR
ncbi:hypothetical protein GC584_10330 [Corynebacterium sp. zg912]|uniref:Secreted protein n=1 Tax=Corynebacterium wankanglinii TaxID=2735136 RepID=A0A7V8UVY1_9CORY|nr:MULTISPECIES: hypothetical protein [Corynebacterium]MBA1838280.1 hypothetical protein [Corynebacterium wankanglinii]MCR5929790.1 hypothetical protein [Corynebacterium sp. zg912]